MFDRRKGVRGNRPIQQFDASIHHAGGRAQVISLNPLVGEARYSGVIGNDTFAFLRAEVLRKTQSAKSLVLDMTRILSTSTVVPPIPIGTYPTNSAPAVVICRPDQIQGWTEYSQNAAATGVVRIVFLESERVQAVSVAMTLAGVVP